MSARRVARAAVAIGAIAASSMYAAPSAHASVVVNGAGSTWSSIAVDQWRADVSRFNININFNAVGSTAGRTFFIQKQVDFAVSEIPFQAAYKDSSGTVVSNEVDQVQKSGRTYAYMPIVAGGTSFMYHLDVAGQRLRNLQLPPDTIAKIFTGVITKWNDPAIVASNPGVPLPAISIKPVIRGDGSGTTAQFTAFMASQTPSVWNAFCQKSGVGSPCPATSLYPDFSGAVAQNLSDGVANYVAASYNNGAITYVEYGYARARNYPVVSVKNRAGQYTQPTAFNVTRALNGATLNSDNTQNLGGVYTNSDPATYPVSSYSYMIVPTNAAPPFSAAKGKALSNFVQYFACAGQQKAERLGYAPMPRNLVVAAFSAASKIPGADPMPPIDYEHCANPMLGSTGGQPKPVTTTTSPATQATTPQNNPNGSVPGNDTGGTGTTQPGSIVTDPQTGEPLTTTPRTDAAGKVVKNAQGQTVNVQYQPVAAGAVVAPPNDSEPISPGIVVAAILGLLALIFTPPFVALRLRRTRT